MANQYTYKVPFTEEELYRDYVELRMSQQEIAAKYATTQKVVWRAMKKMGIKARVAYKRDQHGSQNHAWAGGRYLNSKRAKEGPSRFQNGYYYIYKPGHPNSTNRGYVAEHVYVATEERGSPLRLGECVHHIDMRKHNNAPENLVITDKHTHSLWHNQLMLIAAALLDRGLVGFDAEHGYRLLIDEHQASPSSSSTKK